MTEQTSENRIHYLENLKLKIEVLFNHKILKYFNKIINDMFIQINILFYICIYNPKKHNLLPTYYVNL